MLLNIEGNSAIKYALADNEHDTLDDIRVMAAREVFLFE